MSLDELDEDGGVVCYLVLDADAVIVDCGEQSVTTFLDVEAARDVADGQPGARAVVVYAL